jgi:hypothetical protein
MSYEVILSPAAEDQFANLPAPVQQFIEEKLNRLAENPWQAVHEHGRYLGLATLYHVEENVFDQEAHVFNIPFRFSQDETSLQILAIAVDPPYRKG